ncbi:MULTISPECIES: hypothetical protein [Pseudonocardia]|uniref:Secreted protein n=1 Tax=Pseudonocardia abyssalis TaxID=2792008 RepID=A0ABS6V1E6_9PSEU|nr:hypothetical protein [Pseudonocardia abyssalis]MBW0114278.1 hypothetical protein [Pseudonocardia abyssalis]MBW0138321.1 hypothetical protein [Pseudonocardia abyssalis]
MRTRKQLVVAAIVAATVLGGAGVALADVSTPDDLGQGVNAVTTLVEDLLAQVIDAVDAPRPEGADGLETELPDVDPRFVEGPLGGLINDGPLR